MFRAHSTILSGDMLYETVRTCSFVHLERLDLTECLAVSDKGVQQRDILFSFFVSLLIFPYRLLQLFVA